MTLTQSQVLQPVFTTTEFSTDGTPCTVYNYSPQSLQKFAISVEKKAKAKAKADNSTMRAVKVTNKWSVLPYVMGGFDIETTKCNGFYKDTNEPVETAMPYCFQFAIGDDVIICRESSQFIEVLNELKRRFKLTPKEEGKQGKMMLILVHNLGYEYSFLKKVLKFDSFFGNTPTRPINFIVDGVFVFQDSQKLTNSSLEQLTKDYNTHFIKTKEDFDYSIQRNQKTILKPVEYKYCAVDVLALTEYAQTFLKAKYLTQKMLPITCTQMVARNVEQAAIDENNLKEYLGDGGLQRIHNECKVKAQKYASNVAKKNSLNQKVEAEIYLKKYDDLFPKVAIRQLHEYIYGQRYTRQGHTTYTQGIINPEWFREYDLDDKPVALSTTTPANILTWLYYGGCTMAAPQAWGKHFTESDEIAGRDITSSYPFVMDAFNFPAGEFQLAPAYEHSFYLNDYSFDPDSSDFDSKRWFACMTFINPRVKKETKLIAVQPCSKSVFDHQNEGLNGKLLMHKGTMTVMFTDVAYDIFREFYDYDNVIVHYLYVAQASKLPDYLLNPMNKAYADKVNLKKAGLSGTVEYALAKAIVNSMYGLTVKKPHWHEYTAMFDGVDFAEIKTSSSNGMVVTTKCNVESSVLDTEKLKDACSVFSTTTILNPFWGIWVSGFARWRLCKMIAKISRNTKGYLSDFLYCDTDSIYFKHYREYLDFFLEDSVWCYNRLSKRHSAETLETLAPPAKNDPTDRISNCLGAWTDIATDDAKDSTAYISEFKTIGAKRYLKTYSFKTPGKEPEIHAVVAGLPTKKYVEVKETENGNVVIKHRPISIYTDYCEKAGVDPYEYFKPGFDFMIDFDQYDIGKLAHRIIDEATYAYVDGEYMETPSCTVLSPTGFKGTVSEFQQALYAHVSHMKGDFIYESED